MIGATTPAEMRKIREDDARLKEQQARDFVPEKNEAKPVAYFVVERYFKGPFLGLFVVVEMVTKDETGNDLVEPIRRVVAEGVDIVVAMSNLETALRKRVFR